jgi:hypothetical protein
MWLLVTARPAIGRKSNQKFSRKHLPHGGGLRLETRRGHAASVASVPASSIDICLGDSLAV